MGTEIPTPIILLEWQITIRFIFWLWVSVFCPTHRCCFFNWIAINIFTSIRVPTWSLYVQVDKYFGFFTFSDFCKGRRHFFLCAQTQAWRNELLQSILCGQCYFLRHDQKWWTKKRLLFSGYPGSKKQCISTEKVTARSGRKRIGYLFWGHWLWVISITSQDAIEFFWFLRLMAA